MESLKAAARVLAHSTKLRRSKLLTGAATTLYLLMLIALGGPGSSILQPAAAQATPQTAELAFLEFLKYCPAKEPEMYPFPVQTNNFCASLGLNKANNEQACGAFNMLEALLVTPGGNPLNCRAPTAPDEVEIAMPKLVDKQGHYIPQPLPDRKVNGIMPDTLPTATIMEAEGGTYNWLFKTLTRLAGWAPCEALGNKTAWLQPPGWTLLKIWQLEQDLSQYNLKAGSLPMVAVLRQRSSQARSNGCAALGAATAAAAGANEAVGGAAVGPGASSLLCEGGHLLILVRGSLTYSERKLDFSYTMKPDSAYGPGLLHDGFRSTADKIWMGGLNELLDQEFVNGTAVVRHITIAGHSLGAGVATLLAARMQLYLQQKLRRSKAWRQWPNKQPTISAVLFASPNAGSAAFVSSFNRRINVRSIAFANDMVSQVPCTPLVTACKNAAVPTGNPNGSWPYARVGGVMTFDGSEMPVQQEVWQKMGLYSQKTFCANFLSVNALNKAAHICSYLCKTSMYVDDKENWCMLWPAQGDEASKAVYCMEHSGREPFPTNPLFPEK